MNKIKINYRKLAEFEEKKYCEYRRSGLAPKEAILAAREATLKAFNGTGIDVDPNQIDMFQANQI